MAEQLQLFDEEAKFVRDRPPVLTAKVGTSADLFPDILRIYAKPGDRIADVTYGEGTFWRNVDTDLYECFFTDLSHDKPPAVGGVDMRRLPYEDESMDMVVLDPPYRPLTGRRATGTLERHMSEIYGLNYRLNTQPKIMALYKEALVEAHRVLVPRGYAVVKCQDAVESGRQHWMHIDIFSVAVEELDMLGKDLFILVPTARVLVDRRTQRHARKNHSYFWVFRKR